MGCVTARRRQQCSCAELASQATGTHQCSPVVPPAGLEPAIFGLEDPRLVHSAKRAGALSPDGTRSRPALASSGAAIAASHMTTDTQAARPPGNSEREHALAATRRTPRRHHDDQTSCAAAATLARAIMTGETPATVIVIIHRHIFATRSKRKSERHVVIMID